MTDAIRPRAHIGARTAEFRQGFGDHDDYVATGNHRIQIWKNGELVKTLVVKA